MMKSSSPKMQLISKKDMQVRHFYATENSVNHRKIKNSNFDHINVFVIIILSIINYHLITLFLKIFAISDSKDLNSSHLVRFCYLIDIY